MKTKQEWRNEIAVLRDERATEVTKMRAIVERADMDGRKLSDNEQEAFDRLKTKATDLERRIGVAERYMDDAPEPERRQIAPVVLSEDRKTPDMPTLGREQRMAEWAAQRGSDDGSGFTIADADEFCLGNIMRALVEPAFRSQLTDVERRALAEGTTTTGGFITPEVLSVNMIDKVRNSGRVFAAGATTVPLDSDQQSIPRLSADPTGAWRTENSAFSESQHAFERVTFTPQSYGFIVRTSEELYQDMIPAAGKIIENAITQTAALELDRVALRGTGTAPEPRGVRNQAGVTIQSLGANGATPTRYTDVMTAVGTLLTANREPSGWMMAPRTSQFYAGLADTTNQPLNPPQPIADLDRFVTAQIPTNLTQGTSTDTSEIYVGFWPDLLVGIRLGIQLRLLTERYADTGQYAWRVFLRADVQLAHPESFVVITGARP